MRDYRTEFSVNNAERKVKHMSAIAEASQHLRALSMPCRPGEGVKSAINRVAKIVNDVGIERKILRERIRVSRIEDMWREQARRIDAEEMDAIRAARAAAEAANEAAQKEKNVHEARTQYADLTARIGLLEDALRIYGSNEGRVAMDALLQAGCSLDRAVAALRSTADP